MKVQTLYQENVQLEKQQIFELVEQLKSEDDFLEYVKLLQYFARNYTVMLVSCDTPWGPNLTKEMTAALNHLGFTVDLFVKYRYSYAAIMDAGVLVFEQLSPSEKEPVERTITLGEDKIELLSAGYDTPQGSAAYITINGKIVSTRARGLNFVVYDKEKKQVLDAVNFDVFGNNFIGKHLFDREKMVRDYLEEHPGITLLCFNTPVFPKDRVTVNEEFIHKNNLNLTKIVTNLDKASFAVNRYYDEQGVKEVLSVPEEALEMGGIRRMADKAGELVNIVDGNRITKLQPKHKKRTVFLLGDENVFGVGVRDIHTMASFLQAKFIQNMPEAEIVVENYGRYLKTPTKAKEWKEILWTLPVCPSGGDIVLWNTNKISGVPFIDMTNAALEPRNADLFLDKEHYTPHGHKLIADKLYDGILEQELLKVEWVQKNEIEEILTEGSIKELKEEEDFFSYLEKLKRIAKNHIIMVVSHGTVTRKYFTSGRAEALRKLGLQVNLYGKDNYAYAAILDEGKVVFEEISSEPSETINRKIMLHDNLVEIKAWALGSKEDGGSYVKVSEKLAQMKGGVGILFVVFDRYAQKILDKVSFHTPGKHCACMRSESRKEKFVRYQKEHPDVILVGYRTLSFPETNLNENEQYIVENEITFHAIEKNIKDERFALHVYYTPAEIAEVCTVPKSYHDLKGVRHFNDIKGNCVNIVGGHRITKFQPLNSQRTIFCVGGCLTFGVCNSDEHTVTSHLQKLFNQCYMDEKVTIQNYGYFLEQLDKQSNEELKILEALPVKSGDIILIAEKVPDCPFIDTSAFITETRDFEIFADRGHYTPDGQRLWAEKIYEGLMEYDVLSLAKEAEKRTPPAKSPADFLDENETGELAEYKRMLVDFYKQLSVATEGASEQAVFGSIVMNCNPFTKGHRYLIDRALEKSDYLVVFVVEEDKSIFPFEDRFRLVAEGTEDLPNVILIPSGKFIISSLTFSEYFNKSELQDRVVDTSTDVLMFVREIAPCLRIQKRFAGEEPLDAVTRQYNESMKKILPEYGMEFVEIPRAETEGQVISASRVRALLENKEFDAIEHLVPETTFRYLKERFS